MSTLFLIIVLLLLIGMWAISLLAARIVKG